VYPKDPPTGSSKQSLEVVLLANPPRQFRECCAEREFQAEWVASLVVLRIIKNPHAHLPEQKHQCQLVPSTSWACGFILTVERVTIKTPIITLWKPQYHSHHRIITLVNTTIIMPYQYLLQFFPFSPQYFAVKTSPTTCPFEKEVLVHNQQKIPFETQRIPHIYIYIPTLLLKLDPVNIHSLKAPLIFPQKSIDIPLWISHQKALFDPIVASMTATIIQARVGLPPPSALQATWRPPSSRLEDSSRGYDITIVNRENYQKKGLIGIDNNESRESSPEQHVGCNLQ
jgi:hypothetical protein